MDSALKERVKSDDVVVLELGDSSTVIHLHGATILSWKCKGKEILFLSKQAVLDNKKAIRGGIPLVFPQFGPWDCGPQHGIARISRWSLNSPAQKNENGTISCSFSLTDDESSRAMWNYKFKLIYTVTLCPDSLDLSLSVENTGNENSTFEFTTLMHTYFSTSDIEKTKISGLKGLDYIDKVQGGKTFKEERSDVTVPENYDRVYQNTQTEVRLLTGEHTITLHTENLNDMVVWNPWEEKAKGMSDFGDEEYKTMVCVEAGSVSQPISIQPGETKEFKQKLVVRSNL